MKEEISKILLNISYLFIGGVLLTGIMQQNISLATLLFMGGLAPALMLSVALALLWWDKKLKEKQKTEYKRKKIK